MKFVKMHGLGNDFALIDARCLFETDWNALAPRMCERHTGIGADGLLLLLPSETADVRMRIVNADGSEAEMCGNGIRCFAKYAYERGAIEAGRTNFSVETGAGVMRPTVLTDKGVVTAVRVDMGKPFLEADDVPARCAKAVVDRPLLLPNGEIVRVTSLRLGVPHTIIFVNDALSAPVERLGPMVERDPFYPQGTNVNFVSRLDENTYRIRTWERGCGPTLACGTGACSAAVAGILNGDPRQVKRLLLPLGELTIDWAKDEHVYMTGPAAEVYTGEWNS